MMHKEDCVFCKLVKGQLPSVKIYEDNVVLCFLDIGPVSDGHALLIPKSHYEKLHECPDELLGQIGLRLARLTKAVVSAMQCDGYNVLCNNGRASGQLVDHVHFHIIPRMSGDGVFNRWPAFKYAPGKIEELASKIKSKL